MMESSEPKAVIAGGGLAGLACAKLLPGLEIIPARIDLPLWKGHN